MDDIDWRDFSSVGCAKGARLRAVRTIFAGAGSVVGTGHATERIDRPSIALMSR
jgi:hypothetical protein